MKKRKYFRFWWGLSFSFAHVGINQVANVNIKAFPFTFRKSMNNIALSFWNSNFKKRKYFRFSQNSEKEVSRKKAA